MNIAQLGDEFLKLLPATDEPSCSFRQDQGSSVIKWSYSWKDKWSEMSTRYPRNFRKLGELDLDRDGNIKAFHPNEDGPFQMIEAALQAYVTLEGKNVVRG